MPNPIYANSVTVTFTLDTTKPVPVKPPYIISDVSSTVVYSDGTRLTYPGWGTQIVNKPKPGGADFTVIVIDQGYGSANKTDVANWAMTFLPRYPTTDDSPFGNNKNSVAGQGTSAASKGTFTLDFSNAAPKLKDTGTWDWALMVQMVLPNGEVHCFDSDPEMDVNPFIIA